MQLYILRHADAEPKAATDAARELTEKGEQQAARVAGFCKTHGVKPGVILASPFRRAAQTAAVVAEELGLEPVEARWLASGAEPAAILAQLAALRKSESVMLVGHEPDLSRLVSHLIGARGGSAIVLRKASLTALEMLAFREGGSRLEFSIPVKLM